MFKYVLVAVLAIGVISTAAGFVTQALFTDTAPVAANTFTTGTIDISTSPATALLTNVLMAPGEIIEAPITVTNAGTLQLRYAIQRLADNTDAKAMRDILRLRVGLKNGGACEFPYYDTAGSPIVLVTDTELYEGLNFPATATNTVGDVAQGSQANDRVLASLATEDLCFSVVMPLSTGNAYQNATTTATFDFVSEQTANNP